MDLKEQYLYVETSALNNCAGPVIHRSFYDRAGE